MVYTIIVTYNGESWIRKCLDSLIASSVKTEIVIVDNGSTDQTLKIIRSEYPAIQIKESQENLGFGKANNLGIEYAMKYNPDYLFLLNQDAWIEKDSLKKMIEVSDANEKSLIVSPLHLNGSGSELDFNFAYHIGKSNKTDVRLSDLTGKDAYFSVDFVNAAVWLIKSRHLKTIGGFDPIFFHYGEDNDFANRVKYHGFTIDVEPKAIAYHDRPQKLQYDNLSVGKKIIKRQVPYLIILMDINEPLGKCIRRAAGLCAGEVIKHVRAAKFANICVELLSFSSVFLSSLGKVVAHRRNNMIVMI